MMRYVLSPSILAADFTNLGEQIRLVEEQGAEYLHFDVMDGMFVPSISFGMPVLQSIKKATSQLMDVHLMVEEPIRYVKDFQNAGADNITVHLEACKDLRETIREVHSCGLRCGVSICPDTPVDAVREYLDDIEMVLIMSVYPGFGGQKFIPEALKRIQELREMIEKIEASVDIEVDGGIYPSNVREVLDAGANVIVAGSAVFKGNPAENTKKFMEILKSYE